ncbi:MAG TPA: PAS domain S-box protein [Terriglobales bacterium]|nr:PAS domain S-box protein [Terriglobales bacterium]
MNRDPENGFSIERSFRLSWPMRYGGALFAVTAAVAVWSLTGIMHRDPFAIFMLAVVVIARFLGFGPAVFGTALSVIAIDFFAFEPRFSMGIHAADIGRLIVFVIISLLAASLARQKSQAEVRADQTLEQMAAIVESSDDAIYSATPKGIITSWNHGAEQLYGYRAQEVIGKPVLITVPEDRTHETRSHFEALSRGESIESYQTQRRRKDGSLVPILLSVSPLRDRKGNVIGASAIARDITAQLRAEQALQRSEKLATAGRLTAAIAHEINNPLEAITNLLYLARRDSTRADQHLEMAEREVQRIADIAQQTLGFVREVSEPKALNVSSTLDEVVQLYSTRLCTNRIEVQKDLCEACEIHGFAGELRQLFANLIVNAADAMPKGGRLRLRVTRSREYAGDGRSGVRVTVADNGSGISTKNQSRLFEPFYTTKKDSGTGLGLWLSEGIVRKHHGRIRVRSSERPGQSGTTFSLFLPESA